MITIAQKYAYPLAPCACAGARCRYPDGSLQCWRCWSTWHAWERSQPPYVPVEKHYCACGARVLTEYDRCYNCRHQTQPHERMSYAKRYAGWSA